MKHLNLILVAFSISLLFACYPYETVYTDELDLTLTKYDTEADFSKYKTFVIRDTVGLITNHYTALEKANFYAPGGTSEKVTAAVKQIFLDQGYTEATELASADFAINNVIMDMESTTYYYPGWWYGYPGYWPGYGWGGGGYYPPYYGGGYTTSTYYGTVMTEMIDAQSIINSDEDLPMEIVWQSFIDGIISSDKSYNVQRLERGYTEAFEQSPYLNGN